MVLGTRLSLACVALLVLIAGCEPKRRRRGPLAPEPGSTQSAPAPLGPFPRFGEIAGLTRAGELRSGHPVAAVDAVIGVDHGAAAYGKRGRGGFPPGALIVETLGVGATAIHYVLERKEPGYFPEGGDWQYSVVDAGGATLATGKLQLCARCHAEAPRDHVFEALGAGP